MLNPSKWHTFFLLCFVRENFIWNQTTGRSFACFWMRKGPTIGWCSKGQANDCPPLYVSKRIWTLGHGTLCAFPYTTKKHDPNRTILLVTCWKHSRYTNRQEAAHWRRSRPEIANSLTVWSIDHTVGLCYQFNTTNEDEMSIPSSDILEMQWHLNRVVAFSAAADVPDDDEPWIAIWRWYTALPCGRL